MPSVRRDGGVWAAAWQRFRGDRVGMASLAVVAAFLILVLLAVNRSDYPVIQAVTVYLAAITMLVNVATDVLYKAADPRVVFR